MSTSFNNRVFGCAIIKAINANYNADFSHQPRTLPDGTVYATDKVLKYSVRNYLTSHFNEEKVFFFKSFNESFKPRTLDETYKNHFGDFPINLGKKTENTDNKFFLFSFDGENVIGMIPEKPKPAARKKFFKDLEEDSELKKYQPSVNSVVGKKSISKVREEILKDTLSFDEECFFYYEEDGKPKFIPGDFTEINIVAQEIDNLVTGGIDRKKVLENLLKCIDIRLFGGTYAGKVNLSLHGTSQFTHGVNRFPEGVIYSEQISSPFRNSNEKSADAMQTTLGSQFKLKEGHYVHHLSINPRNLEEMSKAVDNKGVTVDDIAKLKEALCNGVTFYDSAAKAGVENELLFWVQLKEGSKIVLPSFVELVSVANDEKRTIDFSKVTALLAKENVKSQIEKIEVFYNSAITTVINLPDNTEPKELN